MEFSVEAFRDETLIVVHLSDLIKTAEYVNQKSV